MFVYLHELCPIKKLIKMKVAFEHKKKLTEEKFLKTNSKVNMVFFFFFFSTAQTLKYN